MAGWSALNPSEQNFAGQLVPGSLIGSAAVAIVASRAYVVRYVATKTRAITKINFPLAVAAASNDNCDVGIFDSTLTTLLGSAGSTAGKLNASAPSVQQLTLTGTVNQVAGTAYYAAFAAGTFGGSAAQLVGTNNGSAIVSQLFGSTAGTQTLGFQASAFPLAAPFTHGGAIGNCPILALVE